MINDGDDDDDDVIWRYMFIKDEMLMLEDQCFGLMEAEAATHH